MMSVAGKIVGGVFVGAVAFAMSGCARHDMQSASVYGSIKDDFGPSQPSATKRVGQAVAPAVKRVAAAPVDKSAAPVEKVTAGPDVSTPAPAAPSTPDASTSPQRPAMQNAAAAAPSAAPDVFGTRNGGTAPTRSATPASAAPGAPAGAAVKQSDEAAIAARNLAEGRALFAAGKVVESRRRFIAAFSGPSPAAAAWALAQTFDTHYLSSLPSSDGAPDMQRALQLYQTAISRGAPEAQADLDRVRATINQTQQVPPGPAPAPR